MKTQSKIVIIFLISLTLGEAKEDMEIIKEMMVGLKMDMMEMRNTMSERLSVSEKKIVKTEFELQKAVNDLAVTKDELNTAKSDLAVALSDLAITKDDFLFTKSDFISSKDDLATMKSDLVTAKTDLVTKVDDLEMSIANLSDPPYLHICVSHNDYLNIDDQTIPYTSMLHYFTNTEGGWLDMTSGVFTAPVCGTYSVSWATVASLNTDERLEIYLQKNGENILESEHYSQYTGTSGIAADQGSIFITSWG